MIKQKKLLRIALAIGIVVLYAITQHLPDISRPVGFDGDNTLISQAIANQQSDVQVSGFGEVIKVLPDDTRGSRHQRFLVRLDAGEVILIAHNIDLAPRVDALAEGESIAFNGEFEWNNKGGVVHWTHKDPRSRHVDGWLQYRGKKYW